MKATKRILSAFLAALMLLGVSAVSAGAVPPANRFAPALQADIDVENMVWFLYAKNVMGLEAALEDADFTALPAPMIGGGPVETLLQGIFGTGAYANGVNFSTDPATAILKPLYGTPA